MCRFSRAERDAEPRHFDEAARDQRDARVGAEAETVGKAGADRQHVLDRATDFDTDDVGRRVGAEILAGQLARQSRARSRGRARRPSSPSAGRAPTSRAKVGPDSTAFGTSMPSTSLRHLVRQTCRCSSSKPLVAQRQAHAVAQQRSRICSETLAEAVARHGDQQVLAPCDGAREVGLDGRALRETAPSADNAGCSARPPTAPSAPRRGPTAPCVDRCAPGARRAPCPTSRRRARPWPGGGRRRAPRHSPSRRSRWWGPGAAPGRGRSVDRGRAAGLLPRQPAGQRARAALRRSPAAAGTAGSRPCSPAPRPSSARTESR